MSSLIEAIEKANKDFSFIPIYSGKRKLDYQKLLDAPIDEKTKEDIKNLFDSTTYVSWDETIQLLGKSIDRALLEIKGNFYISLDSRKFGSELFFLCYFWHKIETSRKFIDFVDIENLEEHNNLTILIIDDFSITGTNIVSPIDMLKTFKPRNTSQFYAAVAMTTDSSIALLETFGINFFYGGLFNSHYLNLEMLLLLNIGGRESEADEGDEIVPFFSDHKISNVTSNTPYLFHYGKIGDCEIGCLIGYPPDEYVKKIVYDKYFKELGINPPKLYNYKTKI